MKNKHGAEKVLSIYWFAILIIVAGAIVAMVSLFYGTPYDVREMEANIMSNKAMNCFSENGRLNPGLFNENKIFNEYFNLKEECDFVLDAEFESERGEYFLEADFYDINNENVLSISEGNSNLYADCKIQDDKYKKIAQCAEREFYSLSPFDDKLFKIKIISAVGKIEKNVK